MRQLPQLRRIVGGMGFGPADADDILQDVFVEATRGAGEFRGEADVRRWLARVTVNRCLLEYRRRRRWRGAREMLERRRAGGNCGAGDTNEMALRAEEIELVRKALRQMDGVAAALLVLRYFCELDATEIGAILSIPAGTVRSRLHGARLRLAEALAERGIGE